MLCLLVINRFRLDFTVFTLIMAIISALNGLAYTICSLKAFAHINLSVYSLFAMLGGMILPFLQGILFYDEGLTLGKIICMIFLTAALLLTVEKGDRKKKGWIYYAGVFVLNGMSGVISKFFQSSPYEKTDAASFSIWSAIASVVISGVLLLFLLKQVKFPSLIAILCAAGSGAINRIANFLLLIALAVLPASVQYPFITGGVLVVSTALAPLAGQKPTVKELISVALAFIGVLILVIIP